MKHESALERHEKKDMKVEKKAKQKIAGMEKEIKKIDKKKKKCKY